MKNKSRRKFLTKISGWLLGIGFIGATWPYLRSLFPNVLYEPSKRFKIGNPVVFQEGVTFIDDRRIYIFRKGNAFYSISGVCSHLGCTVKYSPFRQEKELTVKKKTFSSKGEFHCACHGSKFYEEGTNYSGPAPKPLEWYMMEISPEDGQLIVDASKTVDRDFRLVV